MGVKGLGGGRPRNPRRKGFGRPSHLEACLALPRRRPSHRESDLRGLPHPSLDRLALCSLELCLPPPRLECALVLCEGEPRGVALVDLEILVGLFRLQLATAVSSTTRGIFVYFAWKLQEVPSA